MTTFPVLNRDILQNDDQRAFWDEIVQGPRGFYCGGPESRRLPDLYNAYMQFPEMGRANFRVAEAIRHSRELSGNLRELIVLTTSQILGARVEYEFHIPFARAEGLSEDLIVAIGEGREPPFANDAERIVYTANVELLKTANLAERTRDEAIALLGHPGLMQMIAAIVIYVTVAYTTNVAKVSLAEDFSADPDQLCDFFTGREPEAADAARHS
jgi:4-carboxymuconolactone decarboxylase